MSVEPNQSTGRRCQHCGVTGLEWRQYKNGRWRLFAPNRTRPHVCPEYEPADDDQDDEDGDEDDEGPGSEK